MSDPVLDRLRGGWQAQPAAPAGRLAFSMPEKPTPNIWRKPLPADPLQAHANLAKAGMEQAALLEHLQAMPSELESLVRGQQKGQVSFSITRQALPPAQQELLDGLRWLETASRQPVSFAAGKATDPRWQEWAAAWQEFRGLMTQAERLVSYMAWVDTELGSRPIAHTVVSWSGDALTDWLAGASRDQVKVHQHELGLALSNRQVLIQVVTLTAQSAAKLSATLSIPGGGLLAIPQVWQYTRRLIEVLQKQHN